MHCIELKIVLDKLFYHHLKWNAIKGSIHNSSRMKNIFKQKRVEKRFDL